MEDEKKIEEAGKDVDLFSPDEMEDVDKLINSCINIISKPVRGASDEDTLNRISKAKAAHTILSDIYSKGRASIIYKIHTAKWGAPTATDYHRVFNIDSSPVERTLLSLIIAERALLAKRGMLKHATIAIVGLAGSGKTTYSVSSMVGASRILGIGDAHIYSYVFFDPIDFIDFVRSRLESRTWVPAVVIDDVGAQISKYWIWLGHRWWAHLFSILDHIKDWCGVMIMTAGSFSIIPSGLRDKIDLVVEANEVMYGRYVMNVFTWYRRDKYRMKMRGVPIYIDVMPPTMMMPKGVWSSMLEKRREIGIARVEEIRKKLEERKEKLEESEDEWTE